MKEAIENLKKTDEVVNDIVRLLATMSNTVEKTNQTLEAIVERVNNENKEEEYV